MADLTELMTCIETGKHTRAVELTTEALAQGATPESVLDALVTGMDKIGVKFKANQVFVPEVLIAARAMKQSMEVLEPKLVESGVQPVATAIIGTVQGDLHDIGKNLVAMMWKGANFKIVDLGTNVPADKFVQAAKDSGAQVIGLSALLTTTMPAMKATVAKLREAGVDCKILIGGAPVTQSFADEIGADGYAADAASAVDKARELVAA